MDMKQKIKAPFLNTLDMVKDQLYQATVNVALYDTAIDMGRINLEYNRDRFAYEKAKAKIHNLTAIAKTDICLN